MCVGDVVVCLRLVWMVLLVFEFCYSEIGKCRVKSWNLFKYEADALGKKSDFH